MKFLIRLFFKTIRAILGPVMLFLDWLTAPKPVIRDASEQALLDSRTAAMQLYHFKTCPFCIKVRREIRRLALNIETRDAQFDQQNRANLQNGGGQIKVPCLRIHNENGEDTWLYESDDIIAHLRQQVVN